MITETVTFDSQEFSKIRQKMNQVQRLLGFRRKKQPYDREADMLVDEVTRWLAQHELALKGKSLTQPRDLENSED